MLYEVSPTHFRIKDYAFETNTILLVNAEDLVLFLILPKFLMQVFDLRQINDQGSTLLDWSN